MSAIIAVVCSYCGKAFEEDSEKYYWHLKIHNAIKEKDLLVEQEFDQREKRKQEDLKRWRERGKDEH